ncbi:hypothetical protein [Vreelandella venusta]|uniref:hypothetical protein n=1 Tax=Vreelandella venusta TaxID=44935 RepID=UPI001168E5CA|nr:hypothetical protein [Halomonas venusta]GEK52374.1 hypothetical protein HVE01_30950 [Halomonas venusta]
MTAATLMLPVDMQRSNEYKYSRKHIDTYLAALITDEPVMEAKVVEGINLLQEWRNACIQRADVEPSDKTYLKNKAARLSQLDGLDMDHLVRQVFIASIYCQIPEPFTSVSGQLAGRLGFSDRGDAILTIAEILAVLCETDVFDITREEDRVNLMIHSRVPVPEDLQGYISQSRYLPPMVCEPSTLTKNSESAYLTHNDSLILGKGNHHNECISLDVINTQNAIPLCLNTAFISSVEEEATFDLADPKKRQQWDRYKEQGYELYSLLAKQGNRFYLTNKVDKRGRIYAQGYHITTMGTSFKKACVDLAEQELVTGVPCP